jgi:hypothetical protein
VFLLCSLQEAIMLAMNYLFDVGDPQTGFAIYGAVTDMPPAQFCKPGFWDRELRRANDGDMLIVKYAPSRRRGVPGAAAKYLFVLHVDEMSRVSLTKLFEMPHERTAARAVAAKVRALWALVDGGAETGQAESGQPETGAEPVYPSAPNEVMSSAEWQAIQNRRAKAAIRERAAAKLAEEMALDDAAARQDAAEARVAAREAAETPEPARPEAPAEPAAAAGGRGRMNLRPVPND